MGRVGDEDNTVEYPCQREWTQNKKIRSGVAPLAWSGPAIGARARYKTNASGITEATIKTVLLLNAKRMRP